jgi:predicted HicB family RNase H-like nuclease
VATTKAQQKAVGKYMKINYDEIKIRIPKGKKEIIKEYADTNGESVNALISRLLKNELGEKYGD